MDQPSGDFNLTIDEVRLIQRFRSLPDYGRAAVESALEATEQFARAWRFQPTMRGDSHSEIQAQVHH